MKLLPQELKEKLPTIEEIEEKKDPTVLAKYFHPLSNWTWYAYAYDPENRIFYGLVDGFELEFGSFSLQEMEEVKVKGLGIERDLHFEPMKLSELQKKLESGKHV